MKGCLPTVKSRNNYQSELLRAILSYDCYCALRRISSYKPSIFSVGRFGEESSFEDFIKYVMVFPLSQMHLTVSPDPRNHGSNARPELSSVFERDY